MTGMALWQRAVYYLGMALMVGGFVWAIYRMAVIHGCPIARFNDLSLIALGLGVAIAPLHPFAPAPAYLSPALRRNPNLASMVWLLALAGTAVAIFALWMHMPNLVWFAALVPAGYYWWFGIQVGQPAVEGQGPRAKGQGEGTGNREQGTDTSGTGSPRAPDDSGSAGFSPRPVGRTAASASLASVGQDSVPASFPRPQSAAPLGNEEDCRLKASAPREDGGQGRPPHQDEEPRDA
jgi:hypothetical protein